MVKYYLDTSIWIDIYENRLGYRGEPLGNYGFKLLMLIKATKSTLVITDLLLEELAIHYQIAEIKSMFVPFKGMTESIIASEIQCEEALRICEERDIPRGDVLLSVQAFIQETLKVARAKRERSVVELKAKPRVATFKFTRNIV